MNYLNDLSLGQDLSSLGENNEIISSVLAGKLIIALLAALIVVGVLFCFFGLKLVKIATAILGFLIGASVGAGICTVLGIDGIRGTAIIIVCALALAALSFFVYRVGVFVMTFLCGFGIFLAIPGEMGRVLLIVAVVVSLVLAVLAVVFLEPVIIVITGVFGGLTAGTSIAILAGFGEKAWLLCVVSIALAIIGIIVQFAMHSRKLGKDEKKKSEEIKEADSMEAEVKKARMILDEEGDEDED